MVKLQGQQSRCPAIALPIHGSGLALRDETSNDGTDQDESQQNETEFHGP